MIDFMILWFHEHTGPVKVLVWKRCTHYNKHLKTHFWVKKGICEWPTEVSFRNFFFWCFLGSLQLSASTHHPAECCRNKGLEDTMEQAGMHHGWSSCCHCPSDMIKNRGKEHCMRNRKVADALLITTLLSHYGIQYQCVQNLSLLDACCFRQLFSWQ